VTAFFQSIFTLFLSWWGVLLIGALDTSVVFFMPFGIDTVVILLAARDDRLFWLYPLLATAGSLAGAAVTLWIGAKIGDVGLERHVSAGRLERIRRRVRRSGALAIAAPALLPPPFPLTPFVLTCGALHVDPGRFFATFGAVRLVRFGTEALLARAYGSGILAILQSDVFRLVVGGLIVIAIAGTIVSAVLLWRSTHDTRRVAG
jgi:membrane protein YqaA with SNARE-associated domain